MIDTTDTLLATRVITTLLQGQEDAAQTPVTIPAGTPPGTYWLGMIVDDLEAITENDEDDNTERVLPKVNIQ